MFDPMSSGFQRGSETFAANSSGVMPAQGSGAFWAAATAGAGGAAATRNPITLLAPARSISW